MPSKKTRTKTSTRSSSDASPRARNDGTRGLHSRARIIAGPFAGRTGFVSAVDYDLAPAHYTLELDGGGTLDNLPADRLDDAPPLAP